MSYRVKAVIEYDGTDYAGFQWQPGRSTIQGEIETVVLRLTGEKGRILGAGRTDAGVHAAGQVVAFDTAWRHSLSDLHRGLNALLSRSIAVQSVEFAEESFHPRFDAISRSYRYSVLNRSLRSPLQERYAWRVARPVDFEAMSRISQLLVGSHDFAAFGQPTQGDSTIRQVARLDWQVCGEQINMDIAANAFLRTMVRSIVGAIVRVGLGEMSPGEFEDCFRGRDRSLAGPPAPPHGLCLMAVHYRGE
jgi:tRNA pseudouridine38-40 synthase